MTEGVKGSTLRIGDVVPTIGAKFIGIGTPDLLRVVDGVGWNGKHTAGWEVMA